MGAIVSSVLWNKKMRIYTNVRLEYVCECIPILPWQIKYSIICWNLFTTIIRALFLYPFDIIIIFTQKNTEPYIMQIWWHHSLGNQHSQRWNKEADQTERIVPKAPFCSPRHHLWKISKHYLKNLFKLAILEPCKNLAKYVIFIPF